MEGILRLYREIYPGFNALHFSSTVRREHGVRLSYSCVKQILQGAGLVKKRRSRGRHRRRRERRPRFGEMLHLDGSRHVWLALVPEAKQTLIQVVDDATSGLLYAQLWDGETSCAVMTAMRDVVHEHGIPEAFYTDRASWAFETPKAGGKVSTTHRTQVGEALARLGVEHIPSYSPQARGRSERMNRTLQDRLVNELKAAGVTTVEGANEYLRRKYIGTLNEEFARVPVDPTPAFVALGDVDLNAIFMKYAESLLSRGVSVGVVATLLAQLVPQALGVSIPIALLVGVLIGLGRLSGDREVVARLHGGVSPYRLLRPVGTLSLAAAAATLWIMIVAIPDANQRFREITFNIIPERVQDDIEPRVFFDDFPGKVLFVRDLLPAGDGWNGVFVADSSRPGWPTVYAANRGRLLVDPGRVMLDYNEDWPSNQLHTVNQISVQYLCGYPGSTAVPPQIKQAMKLIIADMWENRESMVVGQTVTKIPDAVQSLVRNLRMFKA